MKRLFSVTGFLFLCGFAIGQAKDGTAEFQKMATSQPAAVIYLPYSPEVVQKALADYLLKDSMTLNESAIYLKLNSFSNDENNTGKAIQFDMQDAKDYLDNLAIAIKPYASDLQLRLQQKNLADAQDKNRSLTTEGNKLEEERKKIQVQIGENENYKKDKGLAERKAKNDKLIDENQTARLNLSNDITKQIAALAILTD